MGVWLWIFRIRRCSNASALQGLVLVMVVVVVLVVLGRLVLAAVSIELHWLLCCGSMVYRIQRDTPARV